MNCDDVRQYWQLYFDSEGDVDLHFQIRQHLDQCDSCAEWYRLQTNFERQFQSQLNSTAADESLWQRVLPGPQTSVGGQGRWLSKPRVFAAVAAVLLLGTFFLLIPSSKLSTEDPTLMVLAKNLHQDIAVGHQPLELESTSDLDVERYFKGRTPFPVRCPPRKDAGFQVQGCGMSTLQNQPVAFLLGKVGKKPVSVIVMAKGALADFPAEQKFLTEGLLPQEFQFDRTGMVLGAFDRNVVLVIGGASTSRLRRVLDAYGSYPHSDSSSDLRPDHSV